MTSRTALYRCLNTTFVHVEQANAVNPGAGTEV